MQLDPMVGDLRDVDYESSEPDEEEEEEEERVIVADASKKG